MSETQSMLKNSQEIRKLSPGSSFKAIFVVSSLFQKNDKNGKPYYEISVTDSCGTLEAKIWSDANWFDRSDPTMEPSAPAQKLPDEKLMSVIGSTVGTDGKTTEFRGQLQFNFNKLTLLDQEQFPPSQYLPRSPIPIEDLVSRYEELVSSCRPEISNFIRSVYEGDTWKQFRDWPAAVSHHHAYANGLLEHTLSVTDCAKSMAESLRISGYDIDVDIVVAGGLLHDLGKLESYKMTSIPEMTLEGAVLDHIALGYSKFMELAKEKGLDNSIKLQLAHILLSHHGQREYGSPVVPATPEAFVVSAADELDFRVFCWKDSVKDLTEDQPISQWHAATARRFWNR
ncbi:MAG: HD domain-containing protein [Synergistaceae bacterium]|nr:HD domain-containing protein [Synergistaceae bacterium]